MALLRPFAVVGGWTLVSRVLGFVRDILIASFLGAGVVTDAFVVAFRFPNLFRRLVAEGAFTAAFVPLFSRSFEGEGREKALGFAAEALSVLVAALFLFTVLAEIAMPVLMYGLAPGFADEPEKFALTVELTRITFPYLLCMAVVALLGGMLNAVYSFASAAAAPLLLNLVLIGVLLAFGGDDGLGVWLAAGVTVAGLAQVVWLIIACRRAGMAVRLSWPRLTPKVRRFLTLFAPGAVGAGVVQINLLIGTIIASFLPTGAIAYLYYADRVYQLPLGVVGIALGTALLPLLSRQIEAGDEAAAAASLNRAIEGSMLLTLPAAAALMAIPWEIVTVLFEHGRFAAAAATSTAAALTAFALGLPAYVLIKILAPGFFARQDTTTPVKFAAVSVAANIVFSLALVVPLGHVGIALATALAAWLNAVLLALRLGKCGTLALDAQARRRLLRTVLATLLMAGALVAAAWALGPLFAGPFSDRALGLFILVVGGLVVYGGLVHLLGAADMRELRGLFRKTSDKGSGDKPA
jgi:putative peptidoglycan lipid II flippase